jgi:hypothetical protein
VVVVKVDRSKKAGKRCSLVTDLCFLQVIRSGRIINVVVKIEVVAYFKALLETSNIYENSEVSQCKTRESNPIS